MVVHGTVAEYPHRGVKQSMIIFSQLVDKHLSIVPRAGYSPAARPRTMMCGSTARETCRPTLRGRTHAHSQYAYLSGGTSCLLLSMLRLDWRRGCTSDP